MHKAFYDEMPDQFRRVEHPDGTLEPIVLGRMRQEGDSDVAVGRHLPPSIPHLTRSALHRCLQQHGISRLPDVAGDKPQRQKFKRYPIGFFHIDIAEVQTAEGKLFLFVGIDRTSKFAVAQLLATADRKTAWEFLQHMLEAVPYQVHIVFTDNGIQFAEQPRNRNTIYSRPMRFDMICEANGIEHRLTKPNRPWTNGQVERMNRTIKEATVKRFHYDSHDQLRTHLADFLLRRGHQSTGLLAVPASPTT
ncbi:MAG: DDE-type integrase/transposase/recombinase, partial [Tabrizicola sp.]